MVGDLFIPYRINSPQHNDVVCDEEDIFILQNDLAFKDLITDKTKVQRFSVEEFYLFAEKRILFITPDTAITASRDFPSHHKYSIDTILSYSDKITQKVLHISGINAQVTSPSLNFLFRLLLESGSCNDTTSNDGMKTEKSIGLVLKCFPTTPRQQLCKLDFSLPPRKAGMKRKITSLKESSDSMIHRTTIDIDFRFLALKQEHCQLIFKQYSSIFSTVKLSQCEIDSWTMRKQQGEDQEDGDRKALSCSANLKEKERTFSQKLVLSCTQKEFRKFGEGHLLMSDMMSIDELHLILHFMSTGSDVDHLVFIIQNSSGLRSLRIDFLDLDEKTWTRIIKCLRENRSLERLHLAYTENFADAFRRLAPEDRRIRTNDVLELLRINKTLQDFCWPKFQQDEILMLDVERLLMENKAASHSSTLNEN